MKKTKNERALNWGVVPNSSSMQIFLSKVMKSRLAKSYPKKKKFFPHLFLHISNEYSFIFFKLLYSHKNSIQAIVKSGISSLYLIGF